jgi:hypothetical protein
MSSSRTRDTRLSSDLKEIAPRFSWLLMVPEMSISNILSLPLPDTTVSSSSRSRSMSGMEKQVHPHMNGSAAASTNRMICRPMLRAGLPVFMGLS